MIDRLNGAQREDLRLIARERFAQPDGSWHLVGIDPWGLDLKSEDGGVRCEFDDPPVGSAEIAARLEQLVTQARERGD